MPEIGDREADDSAARQQGYISKYLGVAWGKSCGKWVATFDKQYLGVYRDEAEAAQARDQAVREPQPYTRPFPSALTH